jgi:type IV secretion system protein VirB3
MTRRDPIFKGCTRPAMVFGVPIVPLGIVVGVVMLLSVWTKFFLALSLVPIVASMRIVSKTDDQQFRLLGLKVWCRFIPYRNRNKIFWRSSAYSPILFKKR